MPQFATVTLSLWDNQQEFEQTFKLNFTIPVFGQDLIITKTEPKKEEKKPEPQQTKRTAARQMLPRSTIQDMKQSLKEFVDMLNGKHT